MSRDYAGFCAIDYQNEYASCENTTIVWDGEGSYTIALFSQSLAARLLDAAHLSNRIVRVGMKMRCPSDYPYTHYTMWVYGHVLTRVPFLHETAYTVVGPQFSLLSRARLLRASTGRSPETDAYENWQHYRHHYLFEMETQESRALCSR
jgi:hypothetical protein